MTVPSPRTPVQPARGFYAVIISDQASLQEGELVYVKDQNTLYVKESNALVPIVGEGSPATGGLRAGDNISKLVNDVGYITLAEVPADRVQSVNGYTGIVVVSADDIPTTNTVNKFTTIEEINKLAGIETGAQVNEVEEAPQDGSYYVRQNGTWVSLVDALAALDNSAIDGGDFTNNTTNADSNYTIDGGDFS